MKFDIDDFQVRDTAPANDVSNQEESEAKLVEEVNESNVFNGEIIYSENDEKLEHLEEDTSVNLEETKIIPSKELEEILNSDLLRTEADMEENIGESIEESEPEADIEEQEALEELGDLNYHDEDIAPIAVTPSVKKNEDAPRRENVSKKAAPSKKRVPSNKAAAPVRSSSKNNQGRTKTASESRQATHATHGKPVKRTSNGSEGGNRRPQKKENVVKRFFRNLSAMDIGIAIVGVALIAVLVIVGNLFFGQKMAVTKVGSFASVGNQLENLTEIGNAGIKGVITQAADNVEILATDVNDEMIPITVTFTSVEKDLKIKFENKYEETLIENVPFEIDATGPDKQDYHWADEDRDGIIYQEKLMPGEYLVTIKSIDKYNFPDTATKVTVKDKITYTAINIINEIKTEDQIDTAKEDTKKEEIEEEKLLDDTVKWVASTKSIVGGADGYAKVDKATIKDPQTILVGVGSRFWKADEQSVEMEEGTTKTVECTKEGTSYTWSSDNEGVATVSGSEKSAVINGIAAGVAHITCTAEGNSESDTFTVTVTAKAATAQPVTGITLNKTTVTLKAEDTDTLTATVQPDDAANKSVSWSSSDDTVATVADGKITAVKAGKATITCKSQENDNVYATCEVTVTEKEKLTLSLNATTATILAGEEFKIVPTVTGYKTNKGVTYKSDNEAVATVKTDGDGNGIVTGVMKGTAKITVTTVEADADVNGKYLTAEVLITVNANPKLDTVTLLLDESGKQVYIKNAEGKYVEAKWADYYTATEFYIKSETVYKYTGWQTINNKTFFFDENGKAVTGEQVIQGVKYNFASDGSLSMNGGVLGIDVSKWNGNIDWKAVKNAGISFVIIRCGYRGSSTGVLVKDPKFDSYVSGANSAGLKVGIYFFSQAINEVEAVEEASMAISLARSYKISYPVFIDTEKTSGGRANNISKDTRTAVCRAFCETIKNAGYTPGIYASKSWYTDQLNMSTLNAYKIWLAQYASQPSYSGRYDLWQHTSKGKVNGISGDVDLDISYLGY